MGRGAGERRAHGGAKEVSRRSKAEGVLGFESAAKVRDKTQGGRGRQIKPGWESRRAGPGERSSPEVTGAVTRRGGREKGEEGR
jgi:hypothetical protein